MKRQYVHMSSDLKTAQIVAKRWHQSFVILTINAQQAHADGIAFYTGNDDVWLADHVPHQYIEQES